MRSAAPGTRSICPTSGEVLLSAARDSSSPTGAARAHVGGGSHGSLGAGDSLAPLICCGDRRPCRARAVVDQGRGGAGRAATSACREAPRARPIRARRSARRARLLARVRKRRGLTYSRPAYRRRHRRRAANAAQPSPRLSATRPGERRRLAGQLLRRRHRGRRGADQPGHRHGARHLYGGAGSVVDGARVCGRIWPRNRRPVHLDPALPALRGAVLRLAPAGEHAESRSARAVVALGLPGVLQQRRHRGVSSARLPAADLPPRAPALDRLVPWPSTERPRAARSGAAGWRSPSACWARFASA